MLLRKAVYEQGNTHAGEVDLIVATHRNGPTDIITGASMGIIRRMVEMAPGI